jgi:hypothetical protein
MDYTMADKYRFVSSLGIIKKNDEGKWVFVPDPTKSECNFSLTGDIKHILIETIFDIIKEKQWTK